MLTKEFVTAGRAIFTLEVPESFINATTHRTPPKPHYTYRVKFKKANGGFQDTYFVQLLTGPQNTKDYTYVGILLHQEGKIKLTGKSAFNQDSWAVKLLDKVLARVWAGEGHKVEETGFKLYHEGRCGRCGRVLTVPESIEGGIGPICREILGLAPLLRNGKVILEDETGAKDNEEEPAVNPFK